MPDSSRFGPLDSSLDESDVIRMSVDEYETIRLIDAEGYTQEECAGQMDVSRSTIQSIYDSARKKLAASLVNGNVLWIEGGEYRLCDGTSRGCGGGGCQRRRCQRGLGIDPERTPSVHSQETEHTNENRDTSE